jgi:hypothetical protein
LVSLQGAHLAAASDTIGPEEKADMCLHGGAECVASLVKEPDENVALLQHPKGKQIPALAAVNQMHVDKPNSETSSARNESAAPDAVNQVRTCINENGFCFLAVRDNCCAGLTCLMATITNGRCRQARSMEADSASTDGTESTSLAE